MHCLSRNKPSKIGVNYVLFVWLMATVDNKNYRSQVQVIFKLHFWEKNHEQIIVISVISSDSSTPFFLCVWVCV